jgi:hypothetical protein
LGSGLSSTKGTVVATAEDIASLRRLIDESSQDPYTDEMLGARIDASTDELRVLAASIWREKAARYAGLVDVKEGSSDRKLSQLYKQALEMATSLSGGAVVAAATRRPATTRPIERP